MNIQDDGQRPRPDPDRQQQQDQPPTMTSGQGAASAFARLKALREQQARQEAAADHPESEKPQAEA